MNSKTKQAVGDQIYIYIFQANGLLITRFSIVLSALYTSIAMEALVYTPMSALAIGP